MIAPYSACCHDFYENEKYPGYEMITHIGFKISADFKKVLFLFRIK